MQQQAAGPHQPPQQAAPPLRLSLDDFERAMDLLELEHFSAVKSWWEKEQEGEVWCDVVLNCLNM